MTRPRPSPSDSWLSNRAPVWAVTNEIERSASKQDPERFCDIVQPSLVLEAFGGRQGCIRVVTRGFKQGLPLDQLAIEDIAVQGEGAIVTYTQEPPGQILFAREGGRWYQVLNELALQRQKQTGGPGSPGGSPDDSGGQ